MTTGWFHGRVVGLFEDHLKDSRRLKPPESVVIGGENSALEAFVEQQDLARASDALRQTPVADWLRSRSSQLAVSFTVLAFASAILFVIASFRSVLAEVDEYGYGFLFFTVAAMAVSGIGALYFSSLDGSRLWIAAGAIVGLGLLVGSTVPPQFEVERCSNFPSQPRTVALCEARAAT